jgi:hypothetical protein
VLRDCRLRLPPLKRRIERVFAARLPVLGGDDGGMAHKLWVGETRAGHRIEHSATFVRVPRNESGSVYL